MKIHQLVHTLSYGDAISGEVIALQRCFRAMGAESEIFAINVHPTYKGRAHDYRELDPTFMGEVLLHYSLGSPLNELYGRMTLANRTLIYHNLTPSKWFRGVNPRIVEDIEKGVLELPELCRMSNRLLADSHFNAGELSAHGFSVDVLPLTLDPQKWNIERNQGVYDALAGNGSLNVVHVGRLAPNKCIEDIIKSFYFLHHHIHRESRLWLAGIDIDTEVYSFSLKRLVQEMKLDHCVEFMGARADGEIKALYEAGSVYLCMSEHEGFCLPVVEAMAHGMPVVAFASTALPETVGDGGILIQEKRPAEVAALLYELSVDSGLRERVVAAGRHHVARFGYAHFERRVRELFSESVPHAHAASG